MGDIRLLHRESHANIPVIRLAGRYRPSIVNLCYHNNLNHPSIINSSKANPFRFEKSFGEFLNGLDFNLSRKFK
jgi:hypothetical protein